LLTENATDSNENGIQSAVKELRQTSTVSPYKYTVQVHVQPAENMKGRGGETLNV